MISFLHLARSGCRDVACRYLKTAKSVAAVAFICSVLRILHKQPHILKNTDILRTLGANNALKYAPPFSTSHAALTEHADHSHSKVWTAERFLSAGLLGLVPLSLAFPNPAFDYALALALTVHAHWGIEAIATDYVRYLAGAALARIAIAFVYSLSVLTLGGLFYFNYADVGLSQAIRMLWKL